jgi:hypothetical protein
MKVGGSLKKCCKVRAHVATVAVRVCPCNSVVVVLGGVLVSQVYVCVTAQFFRYEVVTLVMFFATGPVIFKTRRTLFTRSVSKGFAAPVVSSCSILPRYISNLSFPYLEETAGSRPT